MAITGLHIPHGDQPQLAVTVDERDAMSYYNYVQGGPVEAACLSIAGREVMVYVNSRYASLDESMTNWRASALFEMSGVDMFGGAIRGDALAVLAAGRGAYERSLPPELVTLLLDSDASS